MDEFWGVLKEDLSKDIYHEERIRKAQLMAEAKARSVFEDTISKAATDEDLNQLWLFIDDDLEKIAKEVATTMIIEDHSIIVDYLHNVLFSGKKEFKRSLAAFTADTEFGKLKVNLEKGVPMGAREYDGEETMYYVTVIDGDKLIASIPFVSEEGDTPPEAQELYDQLEHNNLSNWPPELKQVVEQAAFASGKKLEKIGVSLDWSEDESLDEGEEGYMAFDKDAMLSVEKYDDNTWFWTVKEKNKDWATEVWETGWGKTAENAMNVAEQSNERRKRSMGKHAQDIITPSPQLADAIREFDRLKGEYKAAQTMLKELEGQLKGIKESQELDELYKMVEEGQEILIRVDDVVHKLTSVSRAVPHYKELYEVLYTKVNGPIKKLMDQLRELTTYPSAPSRDIKIAEQKYAGIIDKIKNWFRKTLDTMKSGADELEALVATASKTAGINPHCPSCGGLQLNKKSNDSYSCKSCGHKFKWFKDGTYSHNPDLETHDSEMSAGFGGTHKAGSMKRKAQGSYSEEAHILMTEAENGMRIELDTPLEVITFEEDDIGDDFKNVVDEIKEMFFNFRWALTAEKDGIKKEAQEGSSGVMIDFVETGLVNIIKELDKIKNAVDNLPIKVDKDRWEDSRKAVDWQQKAYESMEQALDGARNALRHVRGLQMLASPPRFKEKQPPSFREKKAQESFEPDMFAPDLYGAEGEVIPVEEPGETAKPNKSYHTTEEIKRWYGGAVPKRDSMVKDQLGNVWKYLGPAGPDTHEIELVKPEDIGPSPDEVIGEESGFAPATEPSEEEQIEMEEGPPIAESRNSRIMKSSGRHDLKKEAQQIACKNCDNWNHSNHICDFWNQETDATYQCEMFEPYQQKERVAVENYTQAPAQQADLPVVGASLKKAQLDNPSMKLIDLYNDDPEELKKAEGADEIVKFLNGLYNKRFAKKGVLGNVLDKRRRRKGKKTKIETEPLQQPFYSTDAPEAYATPKPKKDQELPNVKVRIPIGRFSKDRNIPDGQLIKKAFDKFNSDYLLSNVDIKEITRDQRFVEITFKKKAQYYSSIDEMAEELVDKPSNFGWADAPEDFQENWAMVPLASRDADLLEQSNADAISKEMALYEESGDVEFGRSSHWAVGYVDQLFVKIRDGAGNYTPAFQKLFEIYEALDSYPVLDEDDFNQREYDAQIESIEDNENLVKDDAPENWAQEVFTWLWDNDQDAFREDGYVDEDSVKNALLQLGYMEPEEPEPDWDRNTPEWMKEEQPEPEAGPPVNPGQKKLFNRSK